MVFFGGEKSVRFFWETVEENCVFVFFFTCQFERYERLGKFGVAFQVEDKLFKKSLRKHHLYSFWACLFLPMLFQMHPSVFCRIYAFTPKMSYPCRTKIHRKGLDYATTIKSGYGTKNTHEMFYSNHHHIW